MLKLTSCPLSLLNVEYLAADADFAIEDLLLGMPVLRHVDMDTKTFLEERRGLLDGSDCSSVKPSERKGKVGLVSRLTITGLNLVPNDVVTVVEDNDKKLNKPP